VTRLPFKIAGGGGPAGTHQGGGVRVPTPRGGGPGDQENRGSKKIHPQKIPQNNFPPFCRTHPPGGSPTSKRSLGGTTKRQTLEKSAQGFGSAHTGAGRGTIVGAAYIAGAANCEKRDDCPWMITGGGIRSSRTDGGRRYGGRVFIIKQDREKKNWGNESVQTVET